MLKFSLHSPIELKNISITQHDLRLKLPRDVSEKFPLKRFLNLKRILGSISVKIDFEKNKIFSDPEMHLAERMKQCVVGSKITLIPLLLNPYPKRGVS